ncbi:MULTISPECIES: prepilin-type N-terminal cleavage/methylation domain-containing protein [unclassified Avibacterium]|uniref:prepilin-type N-terminal cleavage/methylation domain-containing protein n=1 Tax=unclassified Avibacterium TaxID=2685287 RepID=UPI00202692D7|nr:MULTISPECIES: prepilin-type N-terminal cleavage/methylation domain-containing protein [unclassified Avibacterium]URL02395.1 prepilin-type N-terminal cleavage/methylation domain-containing protein [Avibacterium sp. 20-126]MCW9717200.1 prepilin-type N-terminal cleavage/methylation domain-containing protein [Avibacterium sp. 21-599]MCW9732523.1 prepilin-type N-terminal cleavage/methylation domain-containing protein [Avibacterium sp. 20-15]URL04679.1 prepilin-type N-terminal cleavage/methylation
MDKMKGFTLLESLIVLLISSLLLLMALPVWQQHQEQWLLGKEQQRLYLFLRTIQRRVENSNQVWFLVANRELVSQKWCIVAQVKSKKICNCLQPHLCAEELMANIYQPLFPTKTMISSKHYFPQEMARISGIRNTIQSDCFLLQAGQVKTLFSFFNVGSLKLKPANSLSACGEP